MYNSVNFSITIWGSECEYRHSEGARLNPRDCYYWLHGICLNPKCAFRHPPLDGLFGPSGTTSGLALLPPLTMSSKQIPMAHAPAYNVTKQSVGCIYFQKGQCLKGERCPFSHGPQASGTVNASPSLQEQPQAFKKDSFGIERCTNQQNITKMSADISLEAPVSSTKPIVRHEGPSSNGLSHAKNLMPHPIANKLPKSQSAHGPVINNNASWSRTQNLKIPPSDEHVENDAEPGEIIGERSSEFDARVDNTNIKGSSQYGRMSTQSGRNYDQRPSDYRPSPIYEINQHVMKPHRISSERSLDRSWLPERRMQQGHESPDEVDRDDLRQRLKQRKMDESRSTVSLDLWEPYHRDDRDKEDKYRGRNLESSISTRLRGRISLPGTSERDLSRFRGRKLSEEPLDTGARSLGGKTTKGEDADTMNFTGPKSLAELKASKLVEKQEQRCTIVTVSHVKNNDTVRKAMNYQEPEGAPSFEGPKPLSVLLKRKREQVFGTKSSGGDEDNRFSGAVTVCAEEVNPSSVPESNVTDSDMRAQNVEAVEEVEDLIPSRDDELIYDGKSSANEDMHEMEDYIEDDAMEDQELQNFEQGGGEYDYEATETENFKTECESQGEEEDELEDEEDFARKVGLIFS